MLRTGLSFPGQGTSQWHVAPMCGPTEDRPVSKNLEAGPDLGESTTIADRLLLGHGLVVFCPFAQGPLQLLASVLGRERDMKAACHG